MGLPFTFATQMRSEATEPVYRRQPAASDGDPGTLRRALVTSLAHIIMNREQYAPAIEVLASALDFHL